MARASITNSIYLDIEKWEELLHVTDNDYMIA